MRHERILKIVFGYITALVFLVGVLLALDSSYLVTHLGFLGSAQQSSQGALDILSLSYFAVMVVFSVNLFRDPYSSTDRKGLTVLALVPLIFLTRDWFLGAFGALHSVLLIVFGVIVATLLSFRKWFHLMIPLLLFSCRAPAKTFQDGETVQVSVCGHQVNARLALTEVSRQRGYMNAQVSPQNNDGILFVFEDDSILSFWMRNVSFPLDILFLAKDGKVISHTEMFPEPGVSPQNLRKYVSPTPARFALEVRHGWTREKSILLGCQVAVPKTLLNR